MKKDETVKPATSKPTEKTSEKSTALKPATPPAGGHLDKTDGKETQAAPIPHDAEKLADTETGAIQGSDTEKVALSNVIEKEHPATHEKHVVVPGTEDNKLTPGETLKTDIQNESTKPAIATNVLKTESNTEEVVTERGEHKDKNYGGVAQSDADEKNKEALDKSIKGMHVDPQEQIKENETLGEKIVKFVDKSKAPEVKLNDFIKSQFAIPKNNEPAEHLRQGTSKQIKGVLLQLVADGKLKLADNNYENLGKGYYFGDDHKLAHHNLDTVQIIAKK